MLSFKKDNPVVTDIKYDNTLLFDVIYNSSTSIIAYSTDFKTTVTKKGHKEDYSFGSNTLAHESASDSGRSAVVLYEYANEEKPKVVAFDRRSKLLFERSFDKKIYAAPPAPMNMLAVLFDDGVELISLWRRDRKDRLRRQKRQKGHLRGQRRVCTICVKYHKKLTTA